MAIDFARRRTVDVRSYPGTTTPYAIGFMLAYPVGTAARQVRADYEAMPQRELVLGDGSGLRVNQTFWVEAVGAESDVVLCGTGCLATGSTAYEFVAQCR